MSNLRAAKLSKHLDSVLQGKQALNRQNNPLFIEAIISNPDAATCVNKLIVSKKGLDSLRSSMRFDLTPSFFNTHATDLLRYISSPELASIDDGAYLRPVVQAIVEPPIFWDRFIAAFQAGQLQEAAQTCFAWLLLQLVQLPGEQAQPHRETAEPALLASLVTSPHQEVRTIAYQIDHIVNGGGKSTSPGDLARGPGGRHDNDFVDFHEISILPTADELSSKEPPFLRPASMLEDPDVDDTILGTHLDNQFRLLREDMLYEMRDELQVAFKEKKGKHRGLMIDGLSVSGIHLTQSSDDTRRTKWGVTLQCHADLVIFKNVKTKKEDTQKVAGDNVKARADRKKFLSDNRNVFRNQSMSCLIIDGEIVAFPSINRDEDLLAKIYPIIVIELEGRASTSKALLKLHQAKHIKLLLIDTAVFAYEPVLTALQEKRSLSLAPELLRWTPDSALSTPPGYPTKIVDAIRSNPHQNLQPLLNTPRAIQLDSAQSNSLLSGLTQQVSLIQGPPGTGKSFIGALLAKCLHDFSDQTILVVCYTNHALDQFLEDLLDIGIPESSIVRLGGKSTTRTANLSLQVLSKISGYKRRQSEWQEIASLKNSASVLAAGVEETFTKYHTFNARNIDILEHLEFDHPDYSQAFHVPESNDGMQQVGKKGRAVGQDYLLVRWVNGQDAGQFKLSAHVQEASEIWNMALDDRKTRISTWKQEMMKDLVDHLSGIAADYNSCLDQVDRKFSQGASSVLQGRRIIGCTTTAAAKYRLNINAARPGVLLVEEAGEILESHILTALGPETKQLILIGDHKQLRPKVNNYLLTVEKGEGFDLNRSLFERLVLKGYPHETLREQHRMRPEISLFVKHLTYPDLVDAPGTRNRPNLRGVRNNVVFINHDKPEDEDSQLEERRDMSAKTSKQNLFEVGMVLKIVRYLAQQGYGSDKIVILTPYLGQLRALKEALMADNDPVLNDLDSHDLVRAGLMTPSAAKVAKKPIRLATIDNYQGEESDIVIAALTRSNSNNDIGFMSASERLTVLLSRARDAFIMIGNAHTFSNARKGSQDWTKFFGLLKDGGQIYDGFPVKCERHPDRTALLRVPSDFDQQCPDGGCLEPCGIMLRCGIHTCAMKCHQLLDHSKTPCEFTYRSRCPNGHPQQWKCHEGPPLSCKKCEHEMKVAEKKQKEEFIRQAKRDAEQRIHDQQMADLEKEISLKRDTIRDGQLSEERKQALLQKQKDLQEAAALAAQASATSSAPTVPPPSGPSPVGPPHEKKTSTPPSKASDHAQRKNGNTSNVKPPVSTSIPARSAAKDNWQHQKTVDGQVNDAIDKIMEMTGLESVKDQVLKIKSKVDAATRQNTSLKDERFNVTMLGNPGTGKTTVARLYGKFLASVGVIPSNEFIETTGSRLANDGIPGIEKLLSRLLQGGGGTVFIDEAYQLTSGHGQGAQVLDFLLAEMENQVGKIIFIFAGYNKEMEKFFEHNPGLTSRVPYTLQFKDYEDVELLNMLQVLIDKKYSGRMVVDDADGILGLYGRVAVRRLGRGRGKPGFGNARALANLFAKIRERQADRLSTERRRGLRPDDFLLTKEDIIGPDPSKVMTESMAWKKLHSMIGLGSIKKAVKNFLDTVLMNYRRELDEKAPFEVSLNRAFIGPPGTGKTTVAKHYGQILSELGLLSNGEVVVKNPADFIGAHLGQSESQTKAILASAAGKVLVIDEAYMLYGGSRSGIGTGNTDPFKTAVIDTIVAEVQGVPGDDRCVLLLGYKQEMEDMFQNVNPGLSRRFSIEDAFQFENYSAAELLQALEWKLNDQDLSATEAAKVTAMEVLDRIRSRPNFGNIGEVENLLGKAKLRYQERQASLPIEKRSHKAPFEPEDFDPEFNRNENAAANLVDLFKDVIGCDAVIKKLQTWQQMAKNMKASGRDPRGEIPTNFLFKGPPGTGKTTTARKMGQVFYDMGFLSSTEVVECSASDLVGEYVGHTGPKTKKLFERALGRVLFVDEAYRLGEGRFAQEAMDEIVGILTQDKFKGKLVVILAGYDREMNELMASNSGLSSRFPEEVIFDHIHPAQCLEILKLKLGKQSIRVDVLDDPSAQEYLRMLELLKELANLPSWGNARDLETLSKKMMGVVFTSPTIPPASSSADGSPDVLYLAGEDAVACFEDMLSSRKERTSNVSYRSGARHDSQPQMTSEKKPPPPSQPAINIRQETKKTEPPILSPPDEPTAAKFDGRDPGVTDEVWRQLQLDKKAAADAERRQREEIARKQAENMKAMREMKEALARAKRLAEAKAEQAALQKAQEELRLKRLAADRARDAKAAALEEQRKRAQEEIGVQAKLRTMGVCVAGFVWIKQSSGYRCAGGGHVVSNAALGI